MTPPNQTNYFNSSLERQGSEQAGTNHLRSVLGQNIDALNGRVPKEAFEILHKCSTENAFEMSLFNDKLTFVFDKNLQITKDGMSDKVLKIRDTHNHKHFTLITDLQTCIGINNHKGTVKGFYFSDILDQQDFFKPLLSVSYNAGEVSLNHNTDVVLLNFFELFIKQVFKINTVSPELQKNLGLFLARFCYCMWLQNIGVRGLEFFNSEMQSLTNRDFSDANLFFRNYFGALASPKFKHFASYTHDLPCISSFLFDEDSLLPAMDYHCRNTLIKTNNYDWSCVSNHFIGNIIDRGVMGFGELMPLGDYISRKQVINVIYKVFLAQLETDLIEATGNLKKLKKIYKSLPSIEVVDLNCGYGDFLIQAYLELTSFEIKVAQEIIKAESQLPDKDKSIGEYVASQITMRQFIGRDISKNACETAKLLMASACLKVHNDFNKTFCNMDDFDNYTLYHVNSILEWSIQVADIADIDAKEFSCIYGDPYCSLKKRYLIGVMPSFVDDNSDYDFEVRSGTVIKDGKYYSPAKGLINSLGVLARLNVPFSKVALFIDCQDFKKHLNENEVLRKNKFVMDFIDKPLYFDSLDGTDPGSYYQCSFIN